MFHEFRDLISELKTSDRYFQGLFATALEPDEVRLIAWMAVQGRDAVVV